MHNTLYGLRSIACFFAIAALSISCGSDKPDAGSSQGLIKEGMTKAEVRELLGRPIEIDTSGLIYDVESNTQRKVERWHYEKRTAVFLNDTLKSANSKLGN